MIETEPVTHDFTGFRGWGHDYTFRPIDGGYRGRVFGWCTPKPVTGDYLLLPNGDSSSRYRVTAHEHPSAQGDMFHADVELAPRSDQSPAAIEEGVPFGGLWPGVTAREAAKHQDPPIDSAVKRLDAALVGLAVTAAPHLMRPTFWLRVLVLAVVLAGAAWVLGIEAGR